MPAGSYIKVSYGKLALPDSAPLVIVVPSAGQLEALPVAYTSAKASPTDGTRRQLAVAELATCAGREDQNAINPGGTGRKGVAVGDVNAPRGIERDARWNCELALGERRLRLAGVESGLLGGEIRLAQHHLSRDSLAAIGHIARLEFQNATIAGVGNPHVPGAVYCDTAVAGGGIN